MSINMEKTQQLEPVAGFGQTAYNVPRVNLLPPEIHDADRLRRTQLLLGGALLGVIAIAGIGVGLAVHSVSQAQDQVAAEQATTTKLGVEEAKYAAVPKILSDISLVENAQSQAMAQDVAWAGVLDQLSAEYPSGFSFLTLSANLNTPAAGAAATAPLTTAGTIGTVNITGTGSAQLKTAEWMEALKADKGLADQYFTSSALTDLNGKTVTSVTSTVNLTDQVLTHRFDRKAK